MDDGFSRSSLRPLPKVLPEYIPVELGESYFKGQREWVARYPVYNNGNASDYVDFVINIPRHIRPWPNAGEHWWVKPTSMHQHKRLIFAEAYTRVGDNDRPPTARTGEELLVSLKWSKRDRDHRGYHDGWDVILPKAYICNGESWRVKVTRIDPRSRYLEVCSIGPDPKSIYRPPEKVGLMSVTPIFGSREALEGDVFSYSAIRSVGDLWILQAEMKDDDHIVRLHCEQLRRVPAGRNKDGKPIEKVVGLVERGRHPYLAELVLVEGDLAPRPRGMTYWSAKSKVDDEDELLRRQHEADELASDLDAEYRANVERDID